MAPEDPDRPPADPPPPPEASEPPAAQHPPAVEDISAAAESPATVELPDGRRKASNRWWFRLRLAGGVLLAGLLAWGRFFPDIVGVLILVAVIFSAHRDRVAEVVTPQPDAHSLDDKPRAARSQRSVILLAMAAMYGIGIIANLTFAMLASDPACGDSYLSILMRSSGSPALTGPCILIARELAGSAALVVPLAFLLMGCAVADYGSTNHPVWYKLPWFGLIGFSSSPPMSWRANAVVMGVMLILGAALLLVVDTRMVPGGKRGARLNLPYTKLAAGTVLVALAGAGLVVVGRSRAARACDDAATHTFDQNLDAVEKVRHTLTAGEQQSLIEAARRTFDSGNSRMAIVKVAMWDNSGLGLFAYGNPRNPQLAVGSIAVRAGRWHVEKAANGYEIFQPLPRSSSWMFFATPATVPSLVERDITTVESVDACGRVVDRDSPGSGFFMVLVTGPGQVRGLRGSSLAAAFPSADLRPVGSLTRGGREAQRVAARFAAALLKEGGEEAAGFTRTPEAAEVVRSFATSMKGRYTVDGDPQSLVFGGQPFFIFDLRGDSGNAHLAVQTAEEDGSWYVVTLQLTSESPPAGLDSPSSRPGVIA